MKNLLNLGKALNKAEQLTINGGYSGCLTNRCFCRKGTGWIQVSCKSTCKDGTDPICH